MTTLTKAQRNQLFDALLTAFPTWDALRLMVELQLEQKLECISSAQKDIQSVVLDLIRWAEARGQLGELTAAALAPNPHNPQLKAFAAMMQAATPPAPPLPQIPGAAEQQGLKEYYERLPEVSVDPLALHTAMIQAFSGEELETLCFNVQQDLKNAGVDLAVNVDMVGGSGKSAKVLNLIEYLDRRSYLSYLVKAVRSARPAII